MNGKYTKRAVTIDAWQWHGEPLDYETIPDWLKAAAANGAVMETCDSAAFGDRRRVLRIDTPEGIMFAHMEDWVIKGVIGEFYPCLPEVFARTYMVGIPSHNAEHRMREALVKIASGMTEDMLGTDSLCREEMQTIARRALEERKEP